MVDDILFWFTVQFLNSWIFRLSSIVFALLIVATALYSFTDLYRSFKPGKRMEKLSVSLFCYWAILLEALLFVMGVGYVYSP